MSEPIDRLRQRIHDLSQEHQAEAAQQRQAANQGERKAAEDRQRRQQVRHMGFLLIDKLLESEIPQDTITELSVRERKWTPPGKLWHFSNGRRFALSGWVLDQVQPSSLVPQATLLTADNDLYAAKNLNRQASQDGEDSTDYYYYDFNYNPNVGRGWAKQTDYDRHLGAASLESLLAEYAYRRGLSFEPPNITAD